MVTGKKENTQHKLRSLFSVPCFDTGIFKLIDIYEHEISLFYFSLFSYFLPSRKVHAVSVLDNYVLSARWSQNSAKNNIDLTTCFADQIV